MSWWDYLLIGLGSLAALYVLWVIIVLVFIDFCVWLTDRF